ncbi:MAG: hypothetical protein MZV64_00390 [Ignavibacteriales bacterium]|nr:hypothetical protein [Ignavibacteriales bacterium]
MTLTFTDLSDATIDDWREFALEHLLGATGRTRNLYDLRAVADIPEKAVRMAVEANSDPSARNIRVAVVVADESAANAIRQGGGAGVARDRRGDEVVHRHQRSRSLARPSAGPDTVTSLHRRTASLARSVDRRLVADCNMNHPPPNRKPYLRLGFPHVCDGHPQRHA